MANKIIFAGGELDSMQIISGNPVESTTAGNFSSGYARLAISCPTSTDIVRGLFIDGSSALVNAVTGETLWFHCEHKHAADSSTVQNWIEFIDTATGYPYLSVRCFAQNFVSLAGNTGTGASPTWTELTGTRITHNGSTLNTFDISWTLGSPHSVSFYVNNNLVATATFTQASATSIGGFTCRGHGSNRTLYYSQLMATTGIPTVTGKVYSARASAAGASNTFASGAYTDITEAVLSDATTMTSTAAGQKYTLTCTDIAVPTGYTIQSVFVWARAKNGGASPTNLKSVIRQGGTDYSSPNMVGMGIGFMAVGAQYATNPAGGSWTQTNFNSIELGAESAA